MSRYEIPSRKPATAGTVGWDNPLTTYVAEVRRELPPGDDSDPLLCWIGSSPGEALRPKDLAEMLVPYATLSPTLLATLRADRAACLDRGPTPLQREMLAWLVQLREPRPRTVANQKTFRR